MTVCYFCGRDLAPSEGREMRIVEPGPVVFRTWVCYDCKDKEADE